MTQTSLVPALRSTWRKSAEHKAAQIKRFLSALVAVVIAQVVSDVTAGKTPFTTVHDVRSLWFYLLPLAWVAWRQLHPALTASQIDSAPGATIVPEEVSAIAPVDPATGAGQDPATGSALITLLVVVAAVLVVASIFGLR